MIRVLGDRVLVLLPPRGPQEVKLSSGLTLMRDPDLMRLPTRGIVVRLGHKANTCDLDDVRSEVHTWFVERSKGLAESWASCGKASDDLVGCQLTGDEIDRVLMKMQPAPFDVQVGDCVIFSASVGDEFSEDGKSYVVLRESDIIGVVPQKENAA